MEENNDLRELLQHTEHELVNLLNKEHKDVVAESAVSLDNDFKMFVSAVRFDWKIELLGVFTAFIRVIRAFKFRFLCF